MTKDLRVDTKHNVKNSFHFVSYEIKYESFLTYKVASKGNSPAKHDILNW